jgi:sec-independent protein translocase protein TatA
MSGINEWLLILLVVLVVFGAGKLKNIGSDLGAAIKSFKEGMGDSEKKPTKKNTSKK